MSWLAQRCSFPALDLIVYGLSVRIKGSIEPWAIEVDDHAHSQAA